MIAGRKYGRLTATRELQSDSRGHLCLWKCECGAEKIIPIAPVKSGGIKSCGCWRRDQCSRTGKNFGGKPPISIEEKKRRFTQSRHCKRCQRLRIPRFFAVDPRNGVPGSVCKFCRRDDARKCYFGISPAEYSELKRNQRGKCAICMKQPERFLQIDHDHKTGNVRGLLCRKCNTLLGMALESEVTLKSAIHYLAASREDTIMKSSLS